MLVLVCAVPQADIERHIQIDALDSALDHPNYDRYGAYQQTLKNHLRHTSYPSYHDLLVKGYGASLTEERIYTVRGDFVTDIFNKETKIGSSSFRSGFSTNIDTICSIWVNAIHIHSKLHLALHQQLQLKTSSKHKESAPAKITST